MFLIDKYYKDLNYITCHNSIINNLITNFNIYDKNLEDIIKFNKYNLLNFQHLIIYGPSENGKEYLVEKLLEQIFNKKIELKDVEYIVSGYTNTKMKITIKQSKYHIIIEPNSNGFDKYLIQEIIQNYAKSKMINILKTKNIFKIIIINKIDNLSYLAQAALRRTMEKYSNTCKFILLSDQLSKIIEPIRSRCIMIRVPLPSNEELTQIILYICNKEKYNISLNNINSIISLSNNKLNHSIWLIEMLINNIKYDNNWENIINNIVKIILKFYYKNEFNNNKLLNSIKKIREQFYILFITNISTQLIIRKIMIKLLNEIGNLYLKYNIINITSIFEQRLNLGTRHIIHIEAYIIKLLYLFYDNNNNNNNNF